MITWELNSIQPGRGAPSLSRCERYLVEEGPAAVCDPQAPDVPLKLGRAFVRVTLVHRRVVLVLFEPPVFPRQMRLHEDEDGGGDGRKRREGSTSG